MKTIFCRCVLNTWVPMFCQYRIFHRTFRLCRRYISSATTCKFKQSTKRNLITGVQICCLVTTVMDKFKTVNLEDDITAALQEGDAAIVKLMNQLKDFVVVVSKEYRNCLLKQIEIVQRATDKGPLSDTWDELPQYRALANELQNELNEYCTMFKVLDSLARNSSSTSSNDIFSKFVEIQNFIENEVDQNRKIEKELLKLVTESIHQEVIEGDD